MPPILSRLAEPRRLLLDGATGTELARRGVGLSMPLWSTGALLTEADTLKRIHEDYVSAGAEVITANTFRTHARSLAPAGMAGRARELTGRAVDIARAAAQDVAWVAGSQAPLEDCYSPGQVTDTHTLWREHAQMSRNLADAGVDLILVETQNTIREAVAATRAAVATGRPVFVSFVCDGQARLLSGESLDEAVRAVLPFAPDAVLVNCLPVSAVRSALRQIQAATPNLPCGAYANTGEFVVGRGWVDSPATDPAVYAREAAHWLTAGAKIIGGCCGTTPEHLRELARASFSNPDYS